MADLIQMEDCGLQGFFLDFVTIFPVNLGREFHLRVLTSVSINQYRYASLKVGVHRQYLVQPQGHERTPSLGTRGCNP